MNKILLEKINDLSRLQSRLQSNDPKETLRIILRTAIKLLNAEVGVIYAVRPVFRYQQQANYVYTPIAEGDLHHPDRIRLNPPTSGGHVETIIQEQFLIVDDLDEQPEYKRDFTTDEDIRAFIGVAIKEERSEEPLAVLFLNYRQRHTFTDEEQYNLRVYASYASLLLQRQRLDQRYHIVQDIGQQITQELEYPRKLFPKLHQLTRPLFTTQHFFMLALYDEQRDTFDLHMWERGRYDHQDEQKLEGSGCRHVLFDPEFTTDGKRSWLINHYSEDQKKPDFPVQLMRIGKDNGADRESCIFAPLFLRGKPLGVLTVQALEPHVYTEEDAQALELLGNHVALALNSMRLFQNLRQLRKVGKYLTGQLSTENLLQFVADILRQTTGADLTVLYLYGPDDMKFERPWISGKQKDPDFSIWIPRNPEDIAYLLLQHGKPIWADVSAQLYKELGRQEGPKTRNFIHREEIVSTAALPLLVRREPEGVLFINFRNPQRFDAPQKEVIKALAGYAAIAIRNARVFGRKDQRRIEELSALLEIDLEISQTLDLEQVLKKIVEKALQLLRAQADRAKADRAVIWLYDEQHDELVPHAQLGFPEGELRTLPLNEAKGIVLYAFRNRKTVLVDDVHTDPKFSRLYIEASEDTVSEAAIPLRDGEEAIGVLHFESDELAAFPPDSQFFYDSLAAQAVVAIKNALERKVLIEIGEQITSELDINEIFDLILKEALKISRCRYGNLVRYNVAKNVLETVAVRGKPSGPQEWQQQLGDGVVGWVAQHKEHLNLPDLDNMPEGVNYVARIERMCSELAVPFIKDGELLGVINVENEELAHFSDRDVSMMKALAVLASVAIENAEAYDKQQRTAKANQTLIEIGKELTQELSLAPLFKLILDRALENLKTNVGHVWLYDEQHDDLYATQSAPEDTDTRIPRGVGVVGTMAITRQSLLIKDVRPLMEQEGAYVEVFKDILSEVAVPIIGEGGQCLGVINASSKELGHFTKEDQIFLEALADQAAIAMQNANRYNELQAERRKLTLLNEVSQLMAEQLDDPDQVMRTLLLGARELTGADLAELDLYQEGKCVRTYCIKQGDGTPEERMHRLDNPVVDQDIVRGIMNWVAQMRQPYFSEGDVREDGRYVALDEDANIVSEGAIPLVSEGELIGVLNVESTRLNAFGEQERENLAIFANRALIAIQNARNYDEAARAAERFEILYEAGRELGKVEEPFSTEEALQEKLEKAYQIIIEIAGKHFDCEVTLRRYLPYRQVVVLVASKDKQKKPLYEVMELGEGANGIVAQYHVDLQDRLRESDGNVEINEELHKKMDPLVIHDVEKPPKGTIPTPSDPETKTLIIAPIKYSPTRYYGNLSLGHTETNQFKDADIELLTGLAMELAITIRRLDAAQETAQAQEREKEVELMSFAGQYALELAHRINSDLGGISDHIQDARTGFENRDQAMFEENLTDIMKEVDSVKGLAKDFSTQAVDEEDLRGDQVDALELVVLVRELLEDLGLSAEEAGSMEKLKGKVDLQPSVIPPHIDLILNISDDHQNLLVHFAPKQFIAIIRNLILNGVDAILHTEQDRGTLEIKTIERDKLVELKVKDDGVGISKQNWHKIFGLFYSTKGSSGFGLWSARRYARINGGELEVLESAEGKGTTFSLRLPKTP